MTNIWFTRVGWYLLLSLIRLWNGWRLRWGFCITILCVSYIMSKSLFLFSLAILILRLFIIIVLTIIKHQFVTLHHFHSRIIIVFLIILVLTFSESTWYLSQYAYYISHWEWPTKKTPVYENHWFKEIHYVQ